MSSIHTIKMPDIGEGIVEVELLAWRVQPGDAVQEDQILADVMTDKATVEIPSPVQGVVQSLGGEAGQLIRVGAELLRIAFNGEVATPALPVEAAAPAPAAAVAVAATPMAAPPAHQPDQLSPDRPIASPAVRRRAWELGVELAEVEPSGPAGRIMQADLDAFVAARGTVAAARQAVPMPAAAPTASASGDDGVEEIRIVGLRRKIAQKMQEAKRRIPHFSYVEEFDVTALEALREQLNARHQAQRGKLTLLPLLARALCRTLPDFPQLNARLDDEAGVLTRHRAVHLGIATQTPAGLMVPVLRHAEALDPWRCAAEIRRLAEAARAGRATRDELSGSTITISSLGPLGGIVTTPVINHPEVAIIGVNRIVERPVFRQGQVVGRLLMNLSSSFDHRVVDGQDAAEFIQALRALLETPALLFVD
ncbi:dihydrolipoamide acetyltransferase family protein [Roseateles violae]|uniref:Dihydrolipoamide acetyltransferase component of pyruvate dehydrogenase complex n=1 Tax=Roseateles violae TaxID=3058042 RepID=A0ABT8DUZ2_9BURK|nr:dihydrolipoamide acetyltransferase family protein [Pelomonas sp. PFR6]MDN3921813.1 dihydrolipoamide acetyltransferase family protein [Pelomonas sp. PFR6]